jgi:putative flippase GtrA
MDKIKQWFAGVFDKLKKIWKDFEDKNPKLSQWVREGGLFVLVSNFVTILRSLLMTFLTPAFIGIWGKDPWGWPQVEVPIPFIDKTFEFNIIGYGEDVGGFSYFIAFLIASLFCEIINFLMQRKFTFRSNGNILYQGSIYFAAWCLVTVIVNAVNSVWTGIAVHFLPDLIYNLGTTFLQGGISMIIFFFVNKIIFTDAPKQEELAK